MRWPRLLRRRKRRNAALDAVAARKDAAVQAHVREAQQAMRSFQDEVAAAWAGRRHP